MQETVSSNVNISTTTQTSRSIVGRMAGILGHGDGVAICTAMPHPPCHLSNLHPDPAILKNFDMLPHNVIKSSNIICSGYVVLALIGVSCT